MKLSVLAARTGAPVATLKYWIRAGILPAGALRNQTTAVYDERHVERVELIRVLRERFDAPIAGIARLTEMIDDPRVPLADVMEACQLIATGIGSGGARTGAEHADARVARLLHAAGWPAIDSVARATLVDAIARTEADGFSVSDELLLVYARGLEAVAAHDVAVVAPEGSRDAMARRLLLGASAQTRLLLAVNQLAHTSVAVRRVSVPGAVVGGAE